MLPADHFVYPEERFFNYVRYAQQFVASHPSRIAVLGAIPDRPEPGYGWIVPSPFFDPRGDGPEPTGFPVSSFEEKPATGRAVRLFHHGCLWNSMVVVCRAVTLWSLGWEREPDLMRRFENLRQVVRAVRAGRVSAEHEALAMSALCMNIRRFDLSRSILSHAAADMHVIPMPEVSWSDWGRPERVAHSLQELRCEPLIGLRTVGTSSPAGRV
ncbi:MAG: hypothetical protein GF355_12830 [Candidatus Eisenbacteria bacterium]|nr:hypothetical protein [Candidatus Eisenbacteria bacterium]